MNVLALDIGTSTIKAAVLDQVSGEPLRPPVKVPYPIDRPTPDAAEIQPDALWTAVQTAAQQAVTAFGDAAAISGIGLSCLTPALVLLDAADQPLTPIWIHLDRRSRPLARRMWAAVGEEFLAEVGIRPLPGGMSALCYAHQVEQSPELRDRVKSYLHVNGWVSLRLTGNRAFDPGNASFSGLFGTMTTRQWSDRWCELFGVDRGWLPPVVCGSTTIGELRPEIASAWGLPSGIPVKIGTADTSSAILAANLGPNDMLHSVGTTQVLATLPQRATPDAARLTRMLGVGTGYVYVTHNPVGGVALDWIHKLSYSDQSADQFYGETIRHALTHETDVVLDPPFLGGDRLEIEARAANFRNLSLGTDRLDLLTAVLQGMRTGHRMAYTALDRGDQPLERVHLTGGGAEIIRKLLPEYADISISPLEEGALRGIARLWDSCWSAGSSG
ncbi:xylulokinase [Tuwongella immobilis]|uniref:Carbohydrate kinase FGGY N-terminal domain-containing protein n=1 Tax=Tuwongella immobilis TaxID=692036 RepID=A0A6C2YL69_9BACT|nr:FGGY-family carbohydrate kinase [Tuwongella immobilis]VIP01662.1 sugar kinase : Hypothetical conserved protein OS=uncultured planctomycete GN=HGMM_F07G10C05 PE=4 SV=1: FGGY_N [Tuwongella immobilis]VTR99074.1 sugar kinase : Hypothetical conserved protein OS=uncultured planctomycete GN=HGMM_F07G10C05 PE=4 SV=1: FGGY_N [Tuwongella immobilis]